MVVIKTACNICGYKGKKINYILEGEEFCAECLIDRLAEYGTIAQLSSNDNGKIVVKL